MQKPEYTQWVFPCSKETMKTIEQGVESVQSKKKRYRNDLIELKTLTNIDVALVSLLLTLKRFCTFS